MSDQPVLTELDDDGVLLVSWNRPRKKNAFNDPQWDGFRDALNQARENDAVSVVVVTGAGDDFSAVVDLSSFMSAEDRDDGQPNGYFGCIDALFTFDKAREIAQWPVSALRATKRTLMLAHRAGIEAARKVEDEGMTQLAGSPANVEAIQAFLEKRKPDFKKLR